MAIKLNRPEKTKIDLIVCEIVKYKHLLANSCLSSFTLRARSTRQGALVSVQEHVHIVCAPPMLTKQQASKKQPSTCQNADRLHFVWNLKKMWNGNVGPSCKIHDALKCCGNYSKLRFCISDWSAECIFGHCSNIHDWHRQTRSKVLNKMMEHRYFPLQKGSNYFMDFRNGLAIENKSMSRRQTYFFFFMIHKNT